MDSTEYTGAIMEEQGHEDTTMHDVTATEEVEAPPKETTTRATRGRPRKTAAAAVAETPMSVMATATRGGRGRKKKVEELVMVEEDETTPQEEVTEVTHEETQIEEEESLPIPGAWHSGPPASTTRKSSLLGLGFKTHTAGAMTDDPELRRKLGELTQKYEALELKYRDLREVAVKEAERNFDRLRKQSEERTAGMLCLVFESCWVITANKLPHSLRPADCRPQSRAHLPKRSRQRGHSSPQAARSIRIPTVKPQCQSRRTHELPHKIQDGNQCPQHQAHSLPSSRSRSDRQD